MVVLVFFYKNIVLFGDTHGIPQLMRVVPKEIIKALVVAEIRPQYHEELKKLATESGIAFLVQPKFNSVAYSEFIESFTKLNADLIICHSYSMIIRPDILNSVGYNAINVHSSLLPKNRGPNPIQWAIIHGEEKTGVTLHYISNELDEGDIISQEETLIKQTDTWVSVQTRLTKISENLLRNNIEKILNKKNKREKQDESSASKNPRLTPATPKIDFKVMSNTEVFNIIRAQVKPLRGAYIIKDNEKIYFESYIELEKIEELRKYYEK